jgi:lysozyme family protein
MRQFYELGRESRNAVLSAAERLGFTRDELFLVGSIYKRENNGFSLTDTNHSHDPGGRTIAGMTVRDNPELSKWDDSSELERCLILLSVYKKYIDKVSRDVPFEVRFLLVHARFVGFDQVVVAVQEYLNIKGKKVAVDGIYGPQTERALSGYDRTPSGLMEFINEASGKIAAREAAQVMNYQKKHKMKVVNLTRGYVNRIQGVIKDVESRVMVV